MAELKNTTVNDTGFLQLPAGTTAQRPTAAAGQMRFNSTTGKVEQYNADLSDWIGTPAAGVVATGGTVYDVDTEGTTYRVHVFTSTGNSTFTVSKGGEAEVLVVAGGGSGGTGNDSGGGGAGGLVNSTINLTVQNYTITVGAGGAVPVTTARGFSTNGEDSEIVGSITGLEIRALGGGRGESYPNNPSAGNGGSGGGTAANQNGAGSALQPSSIWGGFGNAGGNNRSFNSNDGSGGGGAGEPGGKSGQYDGGDGLAVSITGINTFYAGGGMGGGESASDAVAADPLGNTPGLGGGADSFDRLAVPNTGGGGAAHDDNIAGTAINNGASGIVVIRYPLRQENPVASDGKVTDDGLVLDLDFAKPTVYSGSGTTVADSRLSRPGSIVGSLTYNNPRTHRAFFDFSSTGGIITFDDFTDYTDQITIEIVSLIKSTSAYQRTVSKHSDTTSATTSQSCFQLQNTSGGAYRWSIVNTSGTYYNLQTSQTPTLNTIFHFVGTYDGSTMKIFVDGVELNSRSASGNIRESSQPLVIGGERTSSGSVPYEYGGDLFLARVYNIGLTNAQVQQNFEAIRWRFGI